MTRKSFVVLTTLVAMALAGQALVDTAAADNGPPTPSPSPSPTTDSPSPTPDNQPPVAVDDTATVTAGQTVTVDVLANDSDDGLGRPDGTTPHLEVVGVHGGDRVSFTSDTVSYQAAKDAAGTVTFGYDVSDGSLVSTGTVTVTVQPRPALTIHVAKTVFALRTYHIHGRLSPTRRGVSRVRVQRLTGHGHWVPFATRPVDGHGAYAARFRPDRLRSTTFRAIADWADGRHTRSARLRRQVHGRPDAQVSGPLTRGAVRYSWRPGCPVPPRDLRAIHINRIDYQHRVRRGVVVVRAGQARAIVRVLSAAFDKRFPIRRMQPTEHFYREGRRTPEQSDVAAMKSGNTSAFNCRPVTGNPYRVSQHSYGNAIDINTIRNPYVTGSRVYPSTSGKWLRRSPYRPGMILSGGVVASTMRRLGWYWGARWSHPDYQHFSSNGG